MKFGKFVKYYAVATQGILSIVILTLAGIFLGKLISDGPIWPAVFAFIGMCAGLASMVFCLLRLQGKDVNKTHEKSEG